MSLPLFNFNGWYAYGSIDSGDGKFFRATDFIIVTWNAVTKTGMIQFEDAIGNMPIFNEITADPQNVPNFYQLQTGPSKFRRIQVQDEYTICDNPEDPVAWWRLYTAVRGAPPVDWIQSDAWAPDYIKNKPMLTGTALQIQTDWLQPDAAAVDYIKNKPAIPVSVQPDWIQSIPTASDYIKNKPVITGPALQIQTDWLQPDAAAVDYIKNKPVIPVTTPQLQVDWSQVDFLATNYIKNKPVAVQPDWNVSDPASPAFIANKPTPTVIAFDGTSLSTLSTTTINNAGALTTGSVVAGSVMVTGNLNLSGGEYRQRGSIKMQCGSGGNGVTGWGWQSFPMPFTYTPHVVCTLTGDGVKSITVQFITTDGFWYYKKEFSASGWQDTADPFEWIAMIA
jgi:hypothetical protein